MRFTVKVEDDELLRQLRDSRREMNATVKNALVEAARKSALPLAKRAAPRKFAPAITVKASARDAYITTQGPRLIGRIVGLLEFGGTVRTPIVPQQAKALSFGGRFVARVDTPRRYQGKAFLQTAAHAAKPAMETYIRDHVADAIQAHVDRARGRL